MSMLCLAVMCHAPAPPHHRLIPRAKSCLALRLCPVTLSRDSATCRCILRANSCRALCPNPTTHTLRNPTSHSRHTLYPLPTRFPSLSRRTFHPFVVSTPALSNLATFLSMACVLKRFSLTSPRKLPLTCVKRGFLRTAEPHRTSQLSPCAPQVSQCHVHAVPGSDVACPAPSARCHAPAPGFPFLKFLTIISISPTVSS